MILNTIRYLAADGKAWQAWRLAPGTGRFRNYQCLSGSPADLRLVIAAMTYALTGKIATLVAEAQLQLADDAGNTWVVARRGGTARIMRNGVAVDDATSEHALLRALHDLESEGEATPDGRHLSTEIIANEIERDHESKDVRLKMKRHGAAEDPSDALRTIAARQIEDIARGSAHSFNQTGLADPQTLLRLARVLEPLVAQYRELCDQYRELTSAADAPLDREVAGVEQLASEVELLARLEEASAPLLKPGVSLKALQTELARVDGEIAELRTACGLTTGDDLAEMPPLPEDLRKPIEALARLEAYAKLIRASQGARKYCEQNIEPHYQRYLEQLENGLAGDRQLTAELESCLATISLRLRAQQPTAVPAKTWFDRFKSKDDGTSPAAPTHEDDADETGRLAVEWALARVAELGSTVEQSRRGMTSSLQRVDAAHEELVKSYGRLQDHWATVAKAAHLPVELELPQLIALISRRARLVALREHRQELTSRIKSYQSRLHRVEGLITQWRELTGSQNTSDMANVQLLLQEAQSVLRFQETKLKRLSQLREVASDAKARNAVRTLLKTRRQTLLAAWTKGLEDLALAPIDINHEAVPELFRRAGLIRALALVHGTAGNRRAAQRLFEAAPNGEAPIVGIFLWDDVRTDDPSRLELLRQLEDATGGELRLLLIADDGLAQMLASLGLGIATKLVQPATPAATAATPQRAPTQAPAAAAPQPRAPAEARAVIKTRGPQPAASQPQAQPAPAPHTRPAPRDASNMLNERARSALAILNSPRKL